MSIIDKKNNIIHALQSTDNEQLIEEAYKLFYPAEAVESIEISNLPDNIQIKLRQALNDYHNDRYISHEQMKQKMNEWLMK